MKNIFFIVLLLACGVFRVQSQTVALTARRQTVLK